MRALITVPMAQHLTAFLVSLVASVALTPLIRSLARQSRFVAHPVSDRWHRRTVPLLGGIAMILAFAGGLMASSPFEESLIPLLLCTALMSALGLADDIRATAPAAKLVGQMVIAGLVLSIATPISITGWPVIDQLIAFTWIIGITNAFNLLDNMDGLAAGVATLAGLAYLAVLAPDGGSALTVSISAFVGAALGFLVYNYPPASVFMGDGGSHFLGAFLAAATLFALPGMQRRPVHVTVFPLLVLLVPIFDTAFVTLTRRLSGRSALVGGRDHTSHRLVALGASERAAILSLYVLAAAGGVLALAMQRLPVSSAIGLVAVYCLVLVVMGVVLGHVGDGGQQSDALEPPLLWEIGYRRRNLEIMLDIALLTLAYYAAFRLRFPEAEASNFFPPFVRSVPLVVGAQVAGLYAAGKYRQVWRTLTTPELAVLIKGVGFGVTAAVMLVVGLYRLEGFSRGVFAFDALIAFCLLVASRGAASGIDTYLRRRRASGNPALIYGAGRGGALLVRELLQNRDLKMMPIGFIDDDPRKQNLVIEGLPVLGTLASLGPIAARYQISELLVAIRDIEAGRLEDLLETCRSVGLTLRRMRFSLDEVRAVPAVVRRS